MKAVNGSPLHESGGWFITSTRYVLDFSSLQATYRTSFFFFSLSHIAFSLSPFSVLLGRRRTHHRSRASSSSPTSCDIGLATIPCSPTLLSLPSHWLCACVVDVHHHHLPCHRRRPFRLDPSYVPSIFSSICLRCWDWGSEGWKIVAGNPRARDWLAERGGGGGWLCQCGYGW